MKNIIHVSVAFLMITWLVVCFFIGIDKQTKINDLYGWRCCAVKGQPYRKIDLQKLGG